MLTEPQHCRDLEHAAHARHWAAALYLLSVLTTEKKVFQIENQAQP